MKDQQKTVFDLFSFKPTPRKIAANAITIFHRRIYLENKVM